MVFRLIGRLEKQSACFNIAQHAAAYMAKRMKDVKPHVRLPPAAGRDYMCVVRDYKHVGSVISGDGSINADALCRSQSATSAYIPLSMKVFSSSKISLDLKMKLAESLVFSRLFYNAQLWVANSSFAIRALNRVYMQVLRRITDTRRFKATGNVSDIRVRELLNAPSVECVLRRKRLLYIPKL